VLLYNKKIRGVIMKNIINKILNYRKPVIVYETKVTDQDEMFATVLGIKKIDNTLEKERRKKINYSNDMIWNRITNEYLKVGDSVKIMRGSQIPEALVGKIFTIERFNGKPNSGEVSRDQLAIIAKKENRAFIKIKYLKIATKKEIEESKIKDIFNNKSGEENFFL
jgi:hypothetical protein